MTKEEIIAYITTLYVEEDGNAMCWFNDYQNSQEQDPENKTHIETCQKLFYEHDNKARLLHKILKEICKK